MRSAESRPKAQKSEHYLTIRLLPRKIGVNDGYSVGVHGSVSALEAAIPKQIVRLESQFQNVGFRVDYQRLVSQVLSAIFLCTISWQRVSRGWNDFKVVIFTWLVLGNKAFSIN